MFRRIRVMLVKEFLQLFRDPRLRMVVLGAPLVQLVVFAFAITTDVNNISTGVIDYDRTGTSREVVEAFGSSGYFDIVDYYDNIDEAVSAMDHGRIQCYIDIERGFERDIVAGGTAPLQVIVDGTNSTNAGAILGYAANVTARFSAQKMGERYLKLGEVRTDPLQVVSRAWFNEKLESRIFFLPGLMATVMTLITAMLTGLAIVREKEMGTIEQIMVTPIRSFEYILGKTLPFALSGFAVITMMLVLSVLLYHLPVRGNLGLFYLGTLLFFFSSLSAGLLISAASSTQQQAVLSSFLYMMPVILLSGFMFPIANMPQPVQYVTLLNPMRYFIVILRGVLLKGTGFDVLWPQFAALAVLGLVVVTFASRKFTKTLQ